MGLYPQIIDSNMDVWTYVYSDGYIRGGGGLYTGEGRIPTNYSQ